MSETCRVLINQVKQAASRWLFTYTILKWLVCGCLQIKEGCQGEWLLRTERRKGLFQSKGTMQGVSVKCSYSQTGLHDVRSEYTRLHSLAGGMSVVNWHLCWERKQPPCSSYGMCGTRFHVLKVPLTI